MRLHAVPPRLRASARSAQDAHRFYFRHGLRIASYHFARRAVEERQLRLRGAVDGLRLSGTVNAPADRHRPPPAGGRRCRARLAGHRAAPRPRRRPAPPRRPTAPGRGRRRTPGRLRSRRSPLNTAARTATPRTPPSSRIALLAPDAWPASCGRTAPRTALATGANTSAMPVPPSTKAGTSVDVGDVGARDRGEPDDRDRLQGQAGGHQRARADAVGQRRRRSGRRASACRSRAACAGRPRAASSPGRSGRTGPAGRSSRRCRTTSRARRRWWPRRRASGRSAAAASAPARGAPTGRTATSRAAPAA